MPSDALCQTLKIGGVLQIITREVDGDGQERQALIFPALKQIAHAVEHEMVQFGNKPVAFEEGDEPGRGDNPPLGMVPADEGLRPCELAGGQGDLGLKVYLKLSVLQRALHCALNLPFVQKPLPQRVVVEAEGMGMLASEMGHLRLIQAGGDVVLPSGRQIHAHAAGQAQRNTLGCGDGGNLFGKGAAETVRSSHQSNSMAKWSPDSRAMTASFVGKRSLRMPVMARRVSLPVS